MQVCVQFKSVTHKSFYLFSHYRSRVKIYPAMVAILDLRSIQK